MSTETFDKVPDSAPAKIEPAPDQDPLDWAIDAATVFINGFISGLGSGVGVGAAAIAQTDTLDPQTVSIHAGIGMLIAAACHGVKRLIVWHDSHPVPRLIR
mgnify:CR=1 FL=1